MNNSATMDTIPSPHDEVDNEHDLKDPPRPSPRIMGIEHLNHDSLIAIYMTLVRDREAPNETLQSIYNLSRASPHLYVVFNQFRGLIFEMLMLQVMSADTLQAASTYAAALVWSGDASLDDIFRSIRSGASRDAMSASGWRVNMAMLMLDHHDIVASAARKMALQCPPVLDLGDPTTTELGRFERAIYYAALFFRIKAVRTALMDHRNPQSLAGRQDAPDWVPLGAVERLFAREFSVIEMEQIRCVIEILLRHECIFHNEYAMRDIVAGCVTDSLIFFPTDRLAGMQLCFDFMKATHHFVTSEQRQHNMFMIKSATSEDYRAGAMADQMPNFPLDMDTVSAVRDLHAQRPSDETLDTILHRRPAAHSRDDDAGPARMWRHVHGRQIRVTDDTGCLLLCADRHRGYVFWDNKRVDRILADEVEPEEWHDSIPVWILITCSALGRPAYTSQAKADVFLATKPLRSILESHGHQGPFDSERFMCDKICKLVEGAFETDMEHALHYHRTSLHSCPTCELGDRA